MQLTATRTAQFFIQNEYCQIEIRPDSLILSSETSQEPIPFALWNGSLQIKTGLIWGGLLFFAHPKENQQQAWLVQGLPLNECRQFARHALAMYQKWHNDQCQQLIQYLPKWQQSVQDFTRPSAFLTHSKVEKWQCAMEADFQAIDMTFDDIKLRMPQAVTEIEPWLNSSQARLKAANEQWLSAELDNWQELFANIESSPLNESQKRAVLLNDDNNLVLAGAGSGKTSVLTARVAYLLQSQLASAQEILLLAFGKEAAKEMAQRLSDNVGLSAPQVKVSTFHQLGLQIVKQVEQSEVIISPLALDEDLRRDWCIDWLKKHWMTPTNFKRWQKHLSSWPIAYLTGDAELGSHVENPQLIAWLEKQMLQLAAMNKSKKELQQSLIDQDEYSRLNSELGLVWPCYQAWQQQLKEQGHIDFNLMITRATQYVTKGKFISPWRYIMVDEYQDISPQRLALIEALSHQQEDCVLFAVGDDWQSIYQFAGSDVDLTTGFAERFPHSTITYLDTTYRFNNRIGEVANRFVQQNPMQLKKALNSHKQQKANAVTLMPLARVEKVLDQLNRTSKSPQSVFLLARNHYHKPELFSDWQQRFNCLSIEFMTCHASKGKQADFVIILNVDEGQFPAKVKTTHLDGALTQSKDQFLDAEERRLFYVALTRAKKKVWIAYNGSGSSFVQELLEQDYSVSKQ